MLATFVGSGFATFALEVVWFRSLSLYNDTTVYAFAVMLSVVLVGLAAGSALVTPFLGRDLPWLAILASVQCAAGLLALGSLWLLARGVDVAGAVERIAPFERASVRYTMVLAVVTVGPPTLTLGIAFPIGARLYAEGHERTGDAVGRFYAGNTLGAIAGALAAGFVLLPAAGSRAAVAVPAGVLVVTSLLLGWAAGGRRLVPVGALGALAVGVGGLPDPSAAAIASRFPGSALIAAEEGRQATTWVIDEADGGVRRLYVDGLHQAASVTTTAETGCSSPTSATTSSRPTSSSPALRAPASCGRRTTGSSYATRWPPATWPCSGSAPTAAPWSTT